MDGPDFYNDQSNPYPPAFVEIDGGAIVTITQIRSINLDGSQNVPTNVVVSGWATVTLVGSSQLRAAKTQYTIAPGSTPTVRDIADWTNDGQTKTANTTTMYDGSGSEIQNGHITSGKTILPASGTTSVSFQGSSAFTQTPACTVSYQTSFQMVQPQALSSNPYPSGMTLYGQPYIGVYYVCVGN
jgi:hypothetical protein